MPGILVKHISKRIFWNFYERNHWRLFNGSLYKFCQKCSKKHLSNSCGQFKGKIYYQKHFLSSNYINVEKWSNQMNYLNSSYFLHSNFNTNAYPLLEKEEKHKFYDEFLGNCEIRHKKDKMGEYKIVVCEKDGKKTKNIKYDLPPPPDNINIFKLLGAIALTLFGIILAAYGTVLFVTIAANVIIVASIISFFVICFRLIKSRIFGSSRGRRKF